jgi:predicted transcriptional regulator
MEVDLSPEVYDDWFIREVDKELAAAERGEFIDHEEIGKLIDGRFPG